MEQQGQSAGSAQTTGSTVGTGIPTLPVGIIGRCDSEYTRPHLFLSTQDAESYIKSEWLKWVIPGQLARKTYLYEQPKSPRTIRRESGKWIPLPSPLTRFTGINGIEHQGPQNVVLQFT